jgi:two-component system, sensor histidine kinase
VRAEEDRPVTSSAAISLADLAHELRTPLGGIDSMTDLLAMTAATPEQVRLIAGLKAASAHLRRIASLVIDGQDDLSALHQLNPLPVLLSAFLEPLLEAAAARAAVKGLSFQFVSTLPDGIVAEIDSVRTRQMIENLLDNAVKVSSGAVRLAIDGADGLLTFRVQDSGPGFEQQDLKRLFQRRMQVAAGPRGSGIGLSLVKRYAEEAGGQCGALNLREGGAEIWFSLPALCSGAHPGLGAKRALVVEDSYAGRLLMRTMLEHFGFSVELATGGSQAAAAIARGSFDLITVDKILGDSDGITVARDIRRALGRQNPAARIIAVTGRVDEADKAEFAAAGADAFLPKPLSPRALADVLAQLGFQQKSPAKAA